MRSRRGSYGPSNGGFRIRGLTRLEIERAAASTGGGTDAVDISYVPAEVCVGEILWRRLLLQDRSRWRLVRQSCRADRAVQPTPPRRRSQTRRLGRVRAYGRPLRDENSFIGFGRAGRDFSAFVPKCHTVIVVGQLCRRSFQPLDRRRADDRRVFREVSPHFATAARVLILALGLLRAGRTS